MSSMDIASNNGLKLQWRMNFRLRFIVKKNLPVVKDSEALEEIALVFPYLLLKAFNNFYIISPDQNMDLPALEQWWTR